MSFKAELEKFDGPLDLMLHLIKNHKLDIFDLNINVLVEQYVIYLENLKELKLEIEAEYLYELSSLIEYKSKKLLPKEIVEVEDEYEEDPKEKLVKRLIEYQKYKEVSKELFERYKQRQTQISKTISNYEFPQDEQLEQIQGNPNDLLKAMNRVLRRLSLQRPLDTKITEKEISVDQRSIEIKRKLIDLPEIFNFQELCHDCQSIHLFIVTFLSVLDLVRNQIINFRIDENDEIWLGKGKAKDE